MRLATTVSPTTTASTPPARPLRIVYADDMRELRELVAIVLGKEGHTVDTVPDGKLALEHLTRTSPAQYDLLITDHHMPEMNGLELVRQLRHQSFPGKILVFSSEISHEVRDKYRQLAVDRVLPKPIFPAQLRQTLRELFASATPGSS